LISSVAIFGDGPLRKLSGLNKISGWDTYVLGMSLNGDTPDSTCFLPATLKGHLRTGTGPHQKSTGWNLDLRLPAPRTGEKYFCVCGWSHPVFFSLMVLGFERRAFTLARKAFYHLSYSTSPFLCWVFLRYSLKNYLPRLASNPNPPDLCLLSS
jgi:hypothetical protein